jgi:beta-glucosidase
MLRVCVSLSAAFAAFTVNVEVPAVVGVPEIVLPDRLRPAGRLPLTFPKSLDQLPPFEDYSMNGRTYRYMTEEAPYPFGFGLSYTTFAYRDLQITSPGSSGFDAAVTVENTGTVAA